MKSLPNNNLAYPVLLTVGPKFGSAFLLNGETAQYLVTAGHVLFDANTGNLIDGKASGLSYGLDLVSPIHHHLDLERLLADGNLRKHKEADVAVIKVGSVGPVSEDIWTVTFVPGMSRTSAAGNHVVGAPLEGAQKYEDVAIANEVFLFGYPRSIGHASSPQIDPTRPLLRKGIVAGKNDQLKTIIIDCPTYQGNSGGLVLEVIQVDLYTRRAGLIGVATAFVPFVEEHMSVQYGTTNISIENSGYSVVTPMDRVIELI